MARTRYYDSKNIIEFTKRKNDFINEYDSIEKFAPKKAKHLDNQFILTQGTLKVELSVNATFTPCDHIEETSLSGEQ